MVGDFNRSLLLDGFKPSNARLAGTDSQNPRAPITAASRIARLTPQLCDAAPSGAVLAIATADYSALPAAERCKQATRGIDHFALGNLSSGSASRPTP